jgi:hypothetical protein
MSAHQNPYLAEIERVLPRVLALADRDPLSPTLGLADRLHWAWKLQDYANATPQCVVHGLARLVASDLLPTGISPASVIGRIDEMVLAVRRITARDGSLVEAFPNEKSFCVTALGAFDILCAADALEGRATAEQLAAWRRTAAPLIDFICRHDETHGIISNHLATAVAALARWRGEGEARAQTRARALLDVILSHQSGEGFTSEYGGADPGYQSLALFYLADAHLQRPELALSDSLGRSLSFLTWFAHPDGSFGGIYGARNTRFLVPAGFEALAPEIPEAASLAAFARRAFAGQRVVTPGALDDANLAPHFNACAWAASLWREGGLAQVAPLPCENTLPVRRHFPDAGLLVDNGPRHYTVISLAKGGVIAHFDKEGGGARIEPGVAGSLGGDIFTTQAQRKDNLVRIEDGTVSVEAPFVAAIHERPSPVKFLILRILCLTVFRFRPLGEWVKGMLVRRLMSGIRPAGVTNRRTVTLGPALQVTDEQSPAGKLEIIPVKRPFTAIHMASAGYWQKQDDAS